ncbi:TPA: hypothetical protein RCG80_002897 [Enterobacter roggenkampii]|nr:hypothetical protein [Enterobacter roggenkampii]
MKSLRMLAPQRVSKKPKRLLRLHHDSHHNGKQYTAKKLNDNEWQLTSVSAPREKLVLNRWQMHMAGLLEQVEVKV